MSAAVDPDLPLTVPAALQALRNAVCAMARRRMPRPLCAVKEGEYAKFMGETRPQYAWYL
jgi:hypothetical protein